MVYEHTYGTFYKYREIPEEGTDDYEYLYQLIAKRKYYLCKPGKLNDPYDCFPNLICNLTGDELDGHIINTIQAQCLAKKQPILEGSALESKLVEIRGTYQENLNEIFYRTLNRNTGIFSMSECCLNIPQWTYYADTHKGIVLEFHFTNRLIYPLPFKVKYRNDRAEIDIVKFQHDDKYSQEALFQATTIKAKQWKHEEEVRLIDFHYNGTRELPKECLTGIGFGYRTNDKSINLIKSWVTESGANPRYFTVELHPSKSKLVQKYLE